MSKMIPKNKLSPKQRKELHLKARGLWTVKPVTRIKETKKRYKRRDKHQHDTGEGA